MKIFDIENLSQLEAIEILKKELAFVPYLTVGTGHFGSDMIFFINII